MPFVEREILPLVIKKSINDFKSLFIELFAPHCAVVGCAGALRYRSGHICSC